MRSIKVYKDAQELCEAAVKLFIRMADQSIAEHGRFAVALSGGRTPNFMYDLLAQPANADRIDWKNVFVFWGDERYVDFDNKENNSYQAKQHLLDLVPIPEANIFRIPVNGDHEADAKSYETTIRHFFAPGEPVFDCIFLGMGDEGHTASIFPGSALLYEKKSLVKDVYVEVKKMQRISFTPPLINASRKVVFMVTGKEKAEAFKEVTEGEYNPGLYPAQIIKPVNGKLFWMVDEAIATL